MRALASVGAFAATATIAALALTGCSSQSSSTSDSAASTSPSSAGETVTLVVGASPTPHAKILTFIQENLAAEAGISLDIKEYSDYVQPNTALDEGELDANFFQTVPYLEEQSAEFGYDFTAGEGIHLEPLAVYSSTLTDLAAFPAGGTIGIISDTANQARALRLLADNGFVKLPDTGSINVNTVEKLKDFNFQEVEGPQLVRALDDVDVAVINGNYAQEGGLSQAKDALAVESPVDNPAVNVLVWKSDAANADAIAILEGLLHSDEVKKFIEETWTDGSVIPAF